MTKRINACTCVYCVCPHEGPMKKLETVGLGVFLAPPISGVITQTENKR